MNNIYLTFYFHKSKYKPTYRYEKDISIIKQENQNHNALNSMNFK